MKKNYFTLLITVIIFFFTQHGFTQNSVSNNYEGIKTLSVYPNPANKNTSIIHIITKANALKKVVIFNVLGKQVSTPIFTKKEFDISSLNPGIYILNITEHNNTTTRKLIIQ